MRIRPELVELVIRTRPSSPLSAAFRASASSFAALAAHSFACSAPLKSARSCAFLAAFSSAILLASVASSEAMSAAALFSASVSGGRLRDNASKFIVDFSLSLATTALLYAIFLFIQDLAWSTLFSSCASAAASAASSAFFAALNSASSFASATSRASCSSSSCILLARSASFCRAATIIFTAFSALSPAAFCASASVAAAFPGVNCARALASAASLAFSRSSTSAFMESLVNWACVLDIMFSAAASFCSATFCAFWTASRSAANLASASSFDFAHIAFSSSSAFASMESLVCLASMSDIIFSAAANFSSATFCAFWAASCSTSLASTYAFSLSAFASWDSALSAFASTASTLAFASPAFFSNLFACTVSSICLALTSDSMPSAAASFCSATFRAFWTASRSTARLASAAAVPFAQITFSSSRACASTESWACWAFMSDIMLSAAANFSSAALCVFWTASCLAAKSA
mmetsp:Transcript_144926/g.263253  ORF Transcript_144926/g.263253 Transcript_144926/m.263253 type:complete len:467 (-) Transcript_144926:859-2259(-)